MIVPPLRTRCLKFLEFFLPGISSSSYLFGSRKLFRNHKKVDLRPDFDYCHINQNKVAEMTSTRRKKGSGGFREKSGRKSGSGRFGEPTRTVRIPESRIAEVEQWLASLAGARGGPESQFPVSSDASGHRPIYGSRIAAGFSALADDYLEGSLDLNEHLIRRPAATFFIRAQDDSMLGAGIHSGDLLIVDRTIQAQDGHVVIAFLDGEFTVKKLEKRFGKVRLLPENSDYSPIEVEENQELVVWGVVTYVVHGLL